jgi:hypothetical protein
MDIEEIKKLKTREKILHNQHGEFFFANVVTKYLHLRGINIFASSACTAKLQYHTAIA